MWCWRRINMISWTDRVKNEEIKRAREEKKFLLKIKRMDNWIGHILRRNDLVKHVTE
jgi:hypothetical protein